MTCSRVWISRLELMFRTDQLRTDDDDLRASQAASFGVLTGAVDGAAGRHDGPDVASLPLIAWAFVHGLVVLARNGALQAAVDRDVASAELARRLIDVFTAGRAGTSTGIPGR